MLEILDPHTGTATQVCHRPCPFRASTRLSYLWLSCTFYPAAWRTFPVTLECSPTPLQEDFVRHIEKALPLDREVRWQCRIRSRMCMQIRHARTQAGSHISHAQELGWVGPTWGQMGWQAYTSTMHRGGAHRLAGLAEPNEAA